MGAGYKDARASYPRGGFGEVEAGEDQTNETMKPTPEQIHRLICKFQQPLTIRDGVLAVIDYWESIRPPCPNCEKLRADIAELNQRLHERTQAFLRKAARAGR